jgi:hypothetical protein
VKTTLKRQTCVECDAPLPAFRLKRRALTCSAHCGHARQRRLAHRATRRPGWTVNPQHSNPPILGLKLTEAAERIGISRQMAHVVCVEHGLGRVCNDGIWWLTLGELKASTRGRGT